MLKLQEDIAGGQLCKTHVAKELQKCDQFLENFVDVSCMQTCVSPLLNDKALVVSITPPPNL